MTTATRKRGIAAAAVLSIVFIAGACASGSSDDADSASAGDAPAPTAPREDSGGGGSDPFPEESAARDAAVAPEAELAADLDQAAAFSGDAPYSVTTASDNGAKEAPAEEGTDQKLISNGAVQLKSDDVGQTIFDVRNVVDKYAGEVEANATETDDDGKPLRSRLKLRVPTAQFDDAMQELEKVGTLIASSGNTEDVTTEVLDRTIRIQVQRRSIERISVLLEQATSIRDIVNIEGQLSQRQADLAVLEKEQRYLDDQTAMATITVSVERTKAKKPAPKPQDKDDDSGFFSGLSSGWDGLTTFGVGLATVLGALLPWLVVAGVIAIPGLPLYRRLRRREVVAAPAP